MKRRKLLSIPGMALCGLILGVVSRLLDIYTQNLGNIFSQMAIWILLGTVISIYSPSGRRAMGNVLALCLGMLLTYYATAALTKGVYSTVFIAGWTIFALSTPPFAYLAWLTRRGGALSCLISAGIILASFLSSALLFDRVRIYDVVINGALAYFLFFRRRKCPPRK